MSQSPTQQILAACDELIALRAKATQGNVATLNYGIYVQTKTETYDLMIASTSTDDNDLSHSECEANAEFIAHAANNAANLARALKVVTEALIKYESIGAYDEESDDFSNFAAGYALQQAALILKEGTP